MSASPSPSPSAADGPLPVRGATAARVIAVVLHLGIAVWPLSASGLIAPLWAIVLSYVVWLLAGVAMWRIGQRRPWLAVIVPFATLGLWAGFIAFGDAVLGWTA